MVYVKKKKQKEKSELRVVVFLPNLILQIDVAASQMSQSGFKLNCRSSLLGNNTELDNPLPAALYINII